MSRNQKASIPPSPQGEGTGERPGLVVKSTGSWYIVKTDEGREVECKVKGNFRLKGIRSTNPVAVGDRVHIVMNPEGTAFITEIEDRKNYIVRRASNLSKQSHILAANVDQCLLMVTVSHPETSTTFIDRFLATAEAYAVPAKLVSILTMYIGRLGPLTIASVWYFDKGERVRYPEGNIAIG